MIAIPNMSKPKSCWECFNADCDHWGEHGYDNSADCPLIEIDLVRCGECKWYVPRHIEENGIECAGQCIWHIGLKTYCDAHDRENPEDRPRMIIFREPTDFCSYGERRE